MRPAFAPIVRTVMLLRRSQAPAPLPRDIHDAVIVTTRRRALSSPVCG